MFISLYNYLEKVQEQDLCSNIHLPTIETSADEHKVNNKIDYDIE